MAFFHRKRIVCRSCHSTAAQVSSCSLTSLIRPSTVPISYLGAESLAASGSDFTWLLRHGQPYLQKPTQNTIQPKSMACPLRTTPPEHLLLLSKSKSASMEKDGSPSPSGQDSTDTESNNEERAAGGGTAVTAGGLIYLTNHMAPGMRNGGLPVVKEEQQRHFEALRAAGMELSMASSEGFKVLSGEGEELRAYRCVHCRVFVPGPRHVHHPHGMPWLPRPIRV